MPTAPFLTGNWTDDLAWELYFADQLPPDAICTAVCCIVFASMDPPQIVMTRNHRGWELIAGHIEPGETIEEALVRECLEEGGCRPIAYKLLGYRKVTAKVPQPNTHHGGFYPTVGYVPQYMAIADSTIVPHTGEEIIESGVFALHQLPDELEHSQGQLVKQAAMLLKDWPVGVK